VPADLEMVDATDPYYRSGYVFVSRPAQAAFRSLDDPRLATVTIGVHIVGDDGANVPPADALIARGIIDNIRGYSLYGDYSAPSPPADLIHAVGGGEIDVALAWGPVAGYFAAREATPLVVTPIDDAPDVRLAFEIGMGVRRGDRDRRARLNGILSRRAAEVDAILDRFGVPRLAARQTPAPAALVGDPPGPARTAPPPEPGENPFARNLQALGRGRRYFLAYNCAGCHGEHGGGGMGPSLRDEQWLYGSTDAQIAASIADGRAYGMPAWRQMLTPDQIWQITAYIKSLRTEDEPAR
jgi:mono/diheme cytochrome c family protein